MTKLILQRINPKEPKLGYETIEVLEIRAVMNLDKIGRTVDKIYSLDSVATLVCDVITDIKGHNTLAWQDIVDAVEFGNYEVVSGEWK